MGYGPGHGATWAIVSLRARAPEGLRQPYRPLVIAGPFCDHASIFAWIPQPEPLIGMRQKANQEGEAVC